MNKEKIKKIFTIAIVSYFALMVALYFLIGDQIRYKQAKNAISTLEAESVSEELVEGVVVQQKFVNEVDKLESVAVIFHTFWRDDNAGQVTITLLDGTKELAKKTMDAGDIPDQHRVYIGLDNPSEDLLDKTLTIRIETKCEEGHGVGLMMNPTPSELYFNNYHATGTICFETSGQAKILLGEYYWPIMIGIGLILGITLIVTYHNYCSNRNNLIIRSISAVNRYDFLISQLVSRDFKSKYKRSVFGILWSFLNPLLTMIVQFFVFSTLFQTDTKVYPIYLLAGVICFNFFNECTTMCLTSISYNAQLITKVYIPKYIFPLAKTVSSTINLGISLVPLLLVSLIMGLAFKKTVFLMLFFLICLIIFAFGVGLFLSTLMVFFRDIQFLWTVVIQIWMYATPIFYPAEIIPDKYKFIVQLNPLYHFIGNVRKCLMDGISPEPISYVYCLLFALGSLMIGSFVFKKCQDKFTLYL